MTQLIRGVDVSHHQDPDKINWPLLASDFQFAIVRATYGTRADKRVREHVKRANDAGLKVGLYHFFRQGQSAEKQYSAFSAELLDLRPFLHIAPSVDLEPNVEFDGPIVPTNYSVEAREFCERTRHDWGEALIYTTQSFWNLLARPLWFAEYPLWVAHWGVSEPATPGDQPWLIWQDRVSAIPAYSGGHIDQNVAKELPRIGFQNPQTVTPSGNHWNAFATACDRFSEGFQALARGCRDLDEQG